MKAKTKRRLKIFLEFLIFGSILGFVENIIAIHYATDHIIDKRTIIIAIMVVIPFAAIGELIVDRRSLLPKTKNKKLKHLEVFLEFLVFGVAMGIVEDLITIGLVTGEKITMQIIWIVFLVTLPFAILGEIIVDRKDWLFWIKENGFSNNNLKNK